MIVWMSQQPSLSSSRPSSRASSAQRGRRLPPRAPRSTIASNTALFSSLERNAPVGAMRSRRRAPSRRDRPPMERSARNADNEIRKEHSKDCARLDKRPFALTMDVRSLCLFRRIWQSEILSATSWESAVRNQGLRITQAGDEAHSGNAEGEAIDGINTALNADPESVVVLLIHQSETKSFMRN